LIVRFAIEKKETEERRVRIIAESSDGWGLSGEGKKGKKKGEERKN